jgi:hypothetical protein
VAGQLPIATEGYGLLVQRRFVLMSGLPKDNRPMSCVLVLLMAIDVVVVDVVGLVP